MNGEVLLEGHDVTKRFGGLVALDSVDFAVRHGEIVGLIGPNGSGKTTLFDCLTRVQEVETGTIRFKGENITSLHPHEVAHMGLARTFQVMRVYRRLTVLENMVLSRQWRGISLREQLRPSTRELEDRARDLLSFLTLDGHAGEQAGHLSGGQQRLLEIGMALMPDPDLLLLDEAASGVNPALVELITDRIARLNAEEGRSFLLIEHNIRFIEDLCSRVFVLDRGRRLAEGTPSEIKENQAVIDAYFGA